MMALQAAGMKPYTRADLRVLLQGKPGTGSAVQCWLTFGQMVALYQDLPLVTPAEAAQMAKGEVPMLKDLQWHRESERGDEFKVWISESSVAHLGIQDSHKVTGEAGSETDSVVEQVIWNCVRDGRIDLDPETGETRYFLHR